MKKFRWKISPDSDELGADELRVASQPEGIKVMLLVDSKIPKNFVLDVPGVSVQVFERSWNEHNGWRLGKRDQDLVGITTIRFVEISENHRIVWRAEHKRSSWCHTFAQFYGTLDEVIEFFH